MANEELGKTKCPICEEEASLRKSGKSSKPYIMCSDCGFQGFARGHKAVEKMMARLNVAPAANEVPPAPEKKGFFHVDI